MDILNKIKDILNYNPQMLSDKVLIDDYRLALAYYSKSAEDSDSIKYTRQQIKDLLTVIIKEILDRDIELHPDKYTETSAEIFIEVMEDIIVEDEDNSVVKMRQPFGHPCGKWMQKNKFLKYIPDDAKIYIEPYVGGGAIFWSHDKQFEKEIINDLDPDIYHAYKFIKSMTSDDLDKLKGMDWKPSEGRFKSLLNENPQNGVDKFYRFMYIGINSFGRGRKDFTGRDDISERKETAAKAKDRLDRIFNQCKPRLKDVEILNIDGAELVNKYRNNKDVVFFIDPPYPGQVSGFIISDENKVFDINPLVDVLPKVKGKFILTLGDTKDIRDLFKNKGFNIHSHKVVNNANNIPNTRRQTLRKELIITNFKSPVKKVSQQERLEQLEQTEGSWYLVEENGKPHPFVVQYHVRGIVHEVKDIKKILQLLKKNDLAQAKAILSNYKEKINPESELVGKIDLLIDENDIDKFYAKLMSYLNFVVITQDFDKISQDVQQVDDARGNVSKAFREFFDDIPNLDKLNLDNVYNIGNIHIDFRIKDPTHDYLVGITMDTVKISIQDLDDNIHYILRDRLLENKEGDNWLCQKKLRQPYPAWLKVVTPKDPVWSISPQKTGSTIETAGRYFYKASGHGYFGVAKSDFLEFWLFFNEPEYKHLDGRFDFKLIETPKNFSKVPQDAFWMMNRPYKSQVPYITVHDKDKEENKAKADGIEIVWNEKLLDAKELNGFRDSSVDKYSIYKIDKMKQVVIGPALIPGEPDYAGDVLTDKEIEDAFYKYMETSRGSGIMHKGKILNDVVLVEGRILRKQEIHHGLYGTVVLPKGTCEVGFMIKDKSLWDKIVNGDYTGFSIQGVGFRERA